MEFKAVIFDLFETLITEWRASLRRAFSPAIIFKEFSALSVT